MITRDDATPLPIGERFYLLEAAMRMIEEGIDLLHEEAVEEGVEPDNDHLLESLDDLRMTSYASLLTTMVNDTDDAQVLIALMKQHTPDN